MDIYYPEDKPKALWYWFSLGGGLTAGQKKFHSLKKIKDFA